MLGLGDIFRVLSGLHPLLWVFLQARHPFCWDLYIVSPVDGDESGGDSSSVLVFWIRQSLALDGGT